MLPFKISHRRVIYWYFTLCQLLQLQKCDLHSIKIKQQQKKKRENGGGTVDYASKGIEVSSQIFQHTDLRVHFFFLEIKARAD